MGYMSAISECVRCRRVFEFNPDLVPSIAIDGIRRPICQQCVDWVNPKRRANGLPEIVPHPGAYEPEEIG